MTTVTARTNPNLALIKYWGKKSGYGDIPATPSLSIALGGLTTTTTVQEASADTVELNGQRVSDAKIEKWLYRVRIEYNIPPIAIHSENNFPTAGGLASSASGFSALALCINRLFSLCMDQQKLCWLARQGSVSAARSMFGGFVSLDPRTPGTDCVQLQDFDHWDLKVVVAVCDIHAKATSSTEGMARTVGTSPFYSSWLSKTDQDYEDCKIAVAQKDFPRLSEIAELNCFRMHALMLSSQPPLLYWNQNSLAAIDAIRDLQSDGVPVFLTSDAGPQIKAICLPESLAQVRTVLDGTLGVKRTIVTEIGRGPVVFSN